MNEPEDRLRLACYDVLHGRRGESSAKALISGDAVTTDHGPGSRLGLASSPMSKAWELDEGDKAGTFVVRTYLPNFLLPMHYTTHINASPSSPTHPAGANNPNYRPVEAKLQISLRTKVGQDVFLPGADLWLAYTQRSLWQVWDQQDSSPFRSTDYQPEAIYVVPVPAKLGALPMGWRLRMVQLGFAHQSNGQTDPLSRSWNRVYAGAGLEHGEFGVLVRASQRLQVQHADDNPDIVDYLGRGEVSMAWSPGASTLGLTWRTNLNANPRGSLQLDWTHPVFADKPVGLRWYAQLFSGYGETMLDYNHRQTRLGLGLTLFQF